MICINLIWYESIDVKLQKWQNINLNFPKHGYIWSSHHWINVITIRYIWINICIMICINLIWYESINMNLPWHGYIWSLHGWINVWTIRYIWINIYIMICINLIRYKSIDVKLWKYKNNNFYFPQHGYIWSSHNQINVSSIK